MNGEARGPGSVPADVAEWLDTRVGTGKWRPLFDKLVGDILALGPDVQATPGRSTKTEDGLTNYIMFHRRGSGVGAFAYINPRRGGSTWRLGEVPKDSKYARCRNVAAGNKYRVVCGLRSEEAFEEAVCLAKLAYEQAGE